MSRACYGHTGLFLACLLLNAHGPLVVTAARDSYELEGIMASDLQPEMVHDREGGGVLTEKRAVREVAENNLTAGRDRLGGTCCCKEAECRVRRSAKHNHALFEYHLTGGKAMCCYMRGSGIANMFGMMSCPWSGFSKAAADVLPLVNDPCTCQWKVWSNRPKFSDVQQGELGSCYLLAEIASLAHMQPQIIENMFLDHNLWSGSHPVFRTKWLIDGEAVSVAVDPMVPMDQKTEQPFFASYKGDLAGDRAAHNGNAGYLAPNFWPVILEKAFAKIYGSYKAIESGFGTEVIYAITGAPAFDIDRPSNAYGEKDVKWQQLKSSLDNKYPVWASNDGGKYGLSDGHAYAVLGIHDETARTRRMLHVYNPWGENFYNGQRKDLRQADGSFWILEDEFWANMDYVTVAEVRKGYREISLDLGTRQKSAEAVLKFRMKSDRPFVVSVSTLNKRFFEGTQCEGLAKGSAHSVRLNARETPAGGAPTEEWWGTGNAVYFSRFPGKAGEYKIFTKVSYPEKNWDTRVRIYAHELDLAADNAPVLVDRVETRDPKLDDCHAGVGNRENLDEWRDLAKGLEDDFFRPAMESIAYEGTYCGDTAKDIKKKCDMYNTWGSFTRAVC